MCNSNNYNQKTLNEVLLQVIALTDAVDKLSIEVNAMKVKLLLVQTQKINNEFDRRAIIEKKCGDKYCSVSRKLLLQNRLGNEISAEIKHNPAVNANKLNSFEQVYLHGSSPPGSTVISHFDLDSQPLAPAFSKGAAPTKRDKGVMFGSKIAKDVDSQKWTSSKSDTSVTSGNTAKSSSDSSFITPRTVPKKRRIRKRSENKGVKQTSEDRPFKPAKLENPKDNKTADERENISKSADVSQNENQSTGLQKSSFKSAKRQWRKNDKKLLVSSKDAARDEMTGVVGNSNNLMIEKTNKETTTVMDKFKHNFECCCPTSRQKQGDSAAAATKERNLKPQPTKTTPSSKKITKTSTKQDNRNANNENPKGKKPAKPQHLSTRESESSLDRSNDNFNNRRNEDRRKAKKQRLAESHSTESKSHSIEKPMHYTLKNQNIKVNKNPDGSFEPSTANKQVEAVSEMKPYNDRNKKTQTRAANSKSTETEPENSKSDQEVVNKIRITDTAVGTDPPAKRGTDKYEKNINFGSSYSLTNCCINSGDELNDKNIMQGSHHPVNSRPEILMFSGRDAELQELVSSSEERLPLACECERMKKRKGRRFLIPFNKHKGCSKRCGPGSRVTGNCCGSMNSGTQYSQAGHSSPVKSCDPRTYTEWCTQKYEVQRVSPLLHRPIFQNYQQSSVSRTINMPDLNSTEMLQNTDKNRSIYHHRIMEDSSLGINDSEPFEGDRNVIRKISDRSQISGFDSVQKNPITLLPNSYSSSFIFVRNSPVHKCGLTNHQANPESEIGPSKPALFRRVANYFFTRKSAQFVYDSEPTSVSQSNGYPNKPPISSLSTSQNCGCISSPVCETPQRHEDYSSGQNRCQYPLDTDKQNAYTLMPVIMSHQSHVLGGEFQVIELTDRIRHHKYTEQCT